MKGMQKLSTTNYTNKHEQDRQPLLGANAEMLGPDYVPDVIDQFRFVVTRVSAYRRGMFPIFPTPGLKDKRIRPNFPAFNCRIIRPTSR